jgi:ethanolamine utilization cobalamin adenosyltransferase
MDPVNKALFRGMLDTFLALAVVTFIVTAIVRWAKGELVNDLLVAIFTTNVLVNRYMHAIVFSLIVFVITAVFIRALSKEI